MNDKIKQHLIRKSRHLWFVKFTVNEKLVLTGRLAFDVAILKSLAMVSFPEKRNH